MALIRWKFMFLKMDWRGLLLRHIKVQTNLIWMTCLCIWPTTPLTKTLLITNKMKQKRELAKVTREAWSKYTRLWNSEATMSLRFRNKSTIWLSKPWLPVNQVCGIYSGLVNLRMWRISYVFRFWASMSWLTNNWSRGLSKSTMLQV